jgi:hypothetical protein
MKKYLLLSVFVLWAGVTVANDLPPYNELFTYNAVLFQQNPQDTDKELRIFPNPVTDGRLNIKSGEAFHLIQILNITGEIVFSQEYPSGTTSEVIEVTNLEKGMYLVRIGFQDKPNHTAKIIIK